MPRGKPRTGLPCILLIVVVINRKDDYYLGEHIHRRFQIPIASGENHRKHINQEKKKKGAAYVKKLTT